MTTLADFVRRRARAKAVREELDAARRIGLGYRNAARLRRARQSPTARAAGQDRGRVVEKGVPVAPSHSDGHPTSTSAAVWRQGEPSTEAPRPT